MFNYVRIGGLLARADKGGRNMLEISANRPFKTNKRQAQATSDKRQATSGE